MSVRLSALLGSLPAPQRVLVYNATVDTDLAIFDAAQVQVVQSMKPFADALQARGVDVRQAPDGVFDLAVVLLPRAKQLGLAQIEEAASVAKIICVDGQKTDGIESVLKALKKKGALGASTSKAHGKAAVFEASHMDLSEWKDPGTLSLIDGFETRLGVFSSDRIDAASHLLVDHLPEKLPARMADFGAGWGFLSRAVLATDGVQHLTAIEADHRAVQCAKANLDDPRCDILWEDATKYKARERFDGIVMNPPFHTSRAAEPELGKAFIRNAAANLTARGELWLVANRQLPYEETLSQNFAQLREFGGSKGFKLLYASKPFSSRQARA